MSGLPFGGAFAGKRVFLTGHTGFKGSWLAEWLLKLGAEVTGYSLPAPEGESLFRQLELEKRITRHIEADICDFALLRGVVEEAQPDFLLHLAAQPLVRESYADPLRTHATNILGTAHVLEALRGLARPCSAVVVTTDKCYENKEWLHGYRETDRLGGLDPYSASKAAAELLVTSYRHSYFPAGSAVRVASARAGNVIGGGDYAADRIVPDCVRAILKKEPIAIRNRFAVRPWQHVLEPLSGYLVLAAALSQNAHPELASAFNFGPSRDANRTVAELAQEFTKHWPAECVDRSDPNAPHEAKLLQLSTDKASSLLRWEPTWSFAQSVAATAQWYQASAASDGPDLRELTNLQIDRYYTDARAKGLSWCFAAC